MATLNLSNGIRRDNPNATSEQDSFLPSANAAYGPWTSLDTAKLRLASIFDTTDNTPIGTTIAVKENGTLVEYWNPTKNSEFVKKGGSSSNDNVVTNIDSNVKFTNRQSVQEDSTTYLDDTYGSSVPTGTFLVDDVLGNVYLHYGEKKWVKLLGTVLTDAAQPNARIVNASVLSYK